MKEVTDSERIFKKVKLLAKYVLDCEKQIKTIDRETRYQIEALEDLKDIYIKRMENLRNHYHSTSAPGFKIPKQGFKSPKVITNNDCVNKKV